MKTFLIAGLCLAVAAPAAAECVRTPAGRTVCRDAAGQIVAAPPAATGVVVAAPPPAAAGAVVAPRTVERAYPSEATAVRGPNGAAAYNPRTGNAAVLQTNERGVTTTQTTRGGEAKTKNGMGAAQGPGGKTCVKGRSQAKCN